MISYFWRYFIWGNGKTTGYYNADIEPLRNQAWRYKFASNLHKNNSWSAERECIEETEDDRRKEEKKKREIMESTVKRDNESKEESRGLRIIL